jgi:hypothetical protein
MTKKLISILGAIILSLSVAGLTFGQQTKTTTTTTVTKQVQNPDGTWTVVEYPVGKEVVVDLTPATTLTGATGRATILRSADGTIVKVNLTGIPADMALLNLYAVDPTGTTTLLGPLTIENGVATFVTTNPLPLNKFMIIASPESDLATFTPDAPVIFRSVVPAGLAVIPLASSGERDGAVVGERVAATTAPVSSAYNVPLLGIPGFRQGTDTKVKVNFPSIGNSRANIFIEPRHDGATSIKLRFHSLKRAPADKRLVLWAVGPDNTFHRLGQVVNTGKRNEAQIQTETSLPDFGLFVTIEDANEPPQPSGPIYATIIK